MSLYIKTLAEYNYNDVFIEMGSYKGDNIQKALLAGYDKIVGIESRNIWFDICYKRFKHIIDFKVFMLYGDSMDELSEALYISNSPATIFINDHYDNEEYPILEELDYILNCSEDHVFIFDDLSKFGTKEFNYITESDVCDILSDYNYDFIFEDGLTPRDIMIARKII